MVGGLSAPPIAEEEQAEAASKHSVTFVLDGAQLETAQVGKSYQLLNCDDHAHYLMKHKKDPALYRPDITHQALMMILDSPLNKAGKLKSNMDFLHRQGAASTWQALYVRTAKGVLLQVNPRVRLPRTFKRFSGLMVQLLQKLSIRATNGPDKLLKVIKGPVTKHFPAGARRIGFSHSAEELQPMHEYVRGLDDATPLVFVVGAFAHGSIEEALSDTQLSISQYPLSAAYALARITTALEAKWGVV